MFIQLQQLTVQLLTDKALYIPEYKALLVADIHLGKAAHFRKHGIALTQPDENIDLLRLHTLTNTHDITHIYFLGDLFHSAQNNACDDFKAWRAARPHLQCILIQGNHDIMPEHLYQDLDLEVLPQLVLGPLWMTHEPQPQPKEGHINIAGHIHPGISLYGTGRQRIKLPIFYQEPTLLLLPAFGHLTGLFNLKPKKNAQVYAITNQGIKLL